MMIVAFISFLFNIQGKWTLDTTN